MRTTILILLLLAGPVVAGPAEDLQASLARRVESLLGFDKLPDRAWGAYLAGKHGLADAVPRLVVVLREHPGSESREDEAVGLAVLDALIRLDARPRVEDPHEFEPVIVDPDWPPAVRYVLTDRPAPGDRLLVKGTHPLYFRRVEISQDARSGVTRPLSLSDPMWFRYRCLAHLLREDPQHFGLQAAEERWIDYESDEQYKEEAQGFIDSYRKRFAEIVTYLLNWSLLTMEQAEAAELDIRIKVQDWRTSDNQTVLPKLQ